MYPDYGGHLDVSKRVWRFRWESIVGVAVAVAALIVAVMSYNRDGEVIEEDRKAKYEEELLAPIRNEIDRIHDRLNLMQQPSVLPDAAEQWPGSEYITLAGQLEVASAQGEDTVWPTEIVPLSNLPLNAAADLVVGHVRVLLEGERGNPHEEKWHRVKLQLGLPSPSGSMVFMLSMAMAQDRDSLLEYVRNMASSLAYELGEMSEAVHRAKGQALPAPARGDQKWTPAN